LTCKLPRAKSYDSARQLLLQLNAVRGAAWIRTSKGNETPMGQFSSENRAVLSDTGYAIELWSTLGFPQCRAIESEL
jgi:hypothetical protein